MSQRGYAVNLYEITIDRETQCTVHSHRVVRVNDLLIVSTDRAMIDSIQRISVTEYKSLHTRIRNNTVYEI